MCAKMIEWKKNLVMLVAMYIVVTVAVDTAITTEVPTQTKEPTQEDAPVSTRNVGDSDLTNLCPNMVRYVFEGAMPHDEYKAGIFEKYPSPEEEGSDLEVDLRTCVESCCQKSRNNTCNVVFMFKRKCYHVRCVSNEACLPKERTSLTERIQMVLVNPVKQSNPIKGDTSWLDTLKVSKSANEMTPLEEVGGNNNMKSLNFWKQPHKLPYYPRVGSEAGSTSYDEDDFPLAEKKVKQLLMTGPLDDNDGIFPDDVPYFRSNLSPEAPNYISCSLELTSDAAFPRCPLNEECISVNSNTAICKCVRGFIRNRLRVCVSDTLDYNVMDESGSPHNIMLASASLSDATTMQKTSTEPTTKTETKQRLIVSVVSKEVRLPEKEVTLAAFTVPDEQSSNTKYKYLWTLINQPKSPLNGTISDQSQSKVKLSNLSEGLYTFKVTVTGDNGTYGEAMANVTVLPEKRINRVPQVVISPSEQTIRQPTTNAILDGSISTDDDKIVSWHWEVVSGPIGYQPKLPDVNTLQLTDLMSPGNYTFKLTVTDTDNVTNSTTANITVLKGTDYPPVANAGDAVILYLPNNNVTLNGTASSDDHEIVAWEWTKDASDEAKAVDMQNTRTPYVQLSNLEEGMYTFVLKVTDGSGQSSTAKVHVFVKPPTNSPPVAVAGMNMTINLPTNWIILNGSASTDDIAIKTYEWKEKSGPNLAVIMTSNETVANATGLTLGMYEFELTVADGSNNTSADPVWVKVVQEKNSPPVANAGGDQSITLPISAIYFNGTFSSDDLGVVKYQWTREDACLAAGEIVGNSDKSPVMILTNLVSGRYVFKLTVSDEQGLTSTDTASVFVHPDPMIMNLVQLTLPMNISMLTHSALNTIVQKIGLLMGDMKIQVRELQRDSRSNAAILVFYVQIEKAGKSTAVDGLFIERLLKKKLQRDASILGTVFADVRTLVCQNKCSGHGVCNSDTRACVCEAFWMPSFGYFWHFEESNCDWSVLYVFVGVILTLLLMSAVFWGIAIACRQSKKPRSRPKVQKYSLIGNQDEEAPNCHNSQRNILHCNGRNTSPVRHKKREKNYDSGDVNSSKFDLAHYAQTQVPQKYTNIESLLVDSRTSLTDSETDSDVLFESRSKSNGILRVNGTVKNKHNGIDRGKYSAKHGRKVKT